MFDSVINYVDKFGPELLVIQFGLLVILSTLFLWLWFSNRRKYNNLKHAIPAHVVKSYLDSIIQNSTALKSSLFRGGELGGVPSVMPLSDLWGGDNLGLTGAPSTALLEELNQKKALIASLESQLSSYHKSQQELENKLSSPLSDLSSYENKIKELEALLAQSRSGDTAEGANLKDQLTEITKERDEVRDRLKEFEIIADDLANLKRLQQENEHLKRSLAAQVGNASPEVVEAEAEAETEAEAEAEDVISPPEEPIDETPEENITASLEESSEANEEGVESSQEVSQEEEEASQVSEEEDLIQASEEKEQDKPKPERTPEDLLSEFEKMLG